MYFTKSLEWKYWTNPLNCHQLHHTSFILFRSTTPFRIKLHHLIAIFHLQSNTKLFTYLLVLSNNRRHPTVESSIPTIEILLMANVSNFPRGNNNNLIDRAGRPLMGKMLELHSPNRERERKDECLNFGRNGNKMHHLARAGRFQIVIWPWRQPGRPYQSCV